MLFPDKWLKVREFFSSLFIGNVFPRYRHFHSASLALTGLFMAGWFGRKSFPIERLPDFTHSDLARLGYRIAFFVTLAQFVFGPLLLLTLPSVGLSFELYVLIFSGAFWGWIALLLLRYQIRLKEVRIGGAFVFICLLFLIVVLAMGTGRHVYRETALVTHPQLVRERTLAYQAHLNEFNQKLASGEIALPVTGERLFADCAACYTTDRVLVAPSLVEIASLYEKDPDGIVRWAMNPGKKRAQFAQMPIFAHLGPEKLRMFAEYRLEVSQSKR